MATTTRIHLSTHVYADVTWTLSEGPATITLTLNSVRWWITKSGGPSTTSKVDFNLWLYNEANNFIDFDSPTYTWTKGTGYGSASSGGISKTVNKSVTYAKTHTQYARGTLCITFSRKNSDEFWEESAYPYDVNYTVKAKDSYAVTYNANGGSGAPGSQTKWYNENLTLQSAAPTRTDYQFKCWTASGVSYNPGQVYSGNAALSLSAVWNPKISFSANGGAGGPSAYYKTYGAASTLPNAIPTRAGYRFLGWATSSSATTAAYPAGGQLPASLNAATVLYAVWQQLPPTLDVQLHRCNLAGSGPVTSWSATGTDEAADFAGTYAEMDEGTSAAFLVSVSMPSSSVGQIDSIVVKHEDSTMATVSASPSLGSGVVALVVCGATGTYDTDLGYDFTVEVGYTVDTSATVSKTVTLGKAFFTVDWSAGGHGMAVGGPCTHDGFDMQMDAYDHGRRCYPLFVYDSLPSNSSVPTLPCFVLVTGDYGLYYFD